MPYIFCKRKRNDGILKFWNSGFSGMGSVFITTALIRLYNQTIIRFRFPIFHYSTIALFHSEYKINSNPLKNSTIAWGYCNLVAGSSIQRPEDREQRSEDREQRSENRFSEGRTPNTGFSNPQSAIRIPQSSTCLRRAAVHPTSR